jgi:hypothetical protein
LLAQLTAEVHRGRSTTGEASKNDVKEIVLWKSESSAKQRQKNSDSKSDNRKKKRKKS